MAYHIEKFFYEMDDSEKISNLNNRLQRLEQDIFNEIKRSHDEVAYWRDLFRQKYLQHDISTVTQPLPFYDPNSTAGRA